MKIDEINPKDLILGSPAWVDAVYRTPPARAVDGKGRATVRHKLAPREGEKDLVLEGGVERSAAILLKILMNAGYVKRFKSQPFQLTQTLHGVDAYPDILADLTDGRRFVIECKTSRWLSEGELNQQEAVCDALHGTSMQFALWTDKFPISRTTFHNLNHLRRAGNLGYPKPT